MSLLQYTLTVVRQQEMTGEREMQNGMQQPIGSWDAPIMMMYVPNLMRWLNINWC